MTSDPRDRIPSPHYWLFETSRGLDAAIVVVNSALRSFQHQELFPWHLSIVITCQLLGDKGMPTTEENRILYIVEDEISTRVLAKENGVFLARETCRGQRRLTYRISDPRIANGQLGELASKTDSLRQWEYRLEHDASWELAAPELGLLERFEG